MSASSHPVVRLVDGDDASGLANMIGNLLADNLRDFPSRAAVARRARGDLVLSASDRDTSVTLKFNGSEVLVSDGATPGAPTVGGPWLALASLCSGQTNPLIALLHKELEISIRRHPITIILGTYSLSVPLSFYDQSAARRRMWVALGLAATTVATAFMVWDIRRRRKCCSSMIPQG